MTAPHLAPNQTIAGRYVVVALLGFTGEVATYRTTAAGGTEYVVKLFDPAIGQRADVMARLEQVHNSLLQLPESIVRVVDAGYDAGTGAPYAVTELIADPSLGQVVQGSGPLSPVAVSVLVGSIATAMSAAHQLSLHHHGLKPTNVFVGPAPAYAVRVTDFSSAIVRSSSPTHEAYARSAPWWAPEQMHPSSVLTAGADVFSVALMAFYALTGRSFWISCQGEPPDLQQWQAEVMAPRPAASARAQELGASIPPGLDSVFERALAVAPPERFSTLGEFSKAFLAVFPAGDADNPNTVAFSAMGFSETPAPRGGGDVNLGGTLALDDLEVANLFSGGGPTAAATPGAGAPAHPDAIPPMGSGPYPPGAGATPAEGPGPAYPPMSRKKKKSVVPIVVGVVVVVAALSGVAAFFLIPDSSEATSGSDSTAPTAEATTAASGAPPSLPPVDPSADEQPPDTDDTKSEGEDEKGKLVLRCKPDCGTVLINGKKIEVGEDGIIELEPGEVAVALSKPGFVPQRFTLKVEAGASVEKEITFVKPRRLPQKKKNCGDFLNPCK
ncbi:MAG: protein kinase [Myxococcota bacterium]